MAKTGTNLGPVDLSSNIPPVEQLVAKTSTNLGPVDWNSEVPPSRGILWTRAVLHQVSLIFGQPLGQADFQLDAPPVEAFSGQEWYKVGSS